jgi:hypothetical protein
MLLLFSFGLMGAAIHSVEAQTQIPRSEHPKPQFYRAQWLNLNGQWDFAFDFGVSGVEKGWPKDPSGIDKKIVVPFCPESKLSGIGYTDFMPAVWYHRTFTVPKEWDGPLVRGRRSAGDACGQEAPCLESRRSLSVRSEL